MLTKDANLLIYVSLALSFLTVLLTYAFIPESPKYLHATGQFQECRSVLSYIANVNGQTESNFD